MGEVEFQETKTVGSLNELSEQIDLLSKLPDKEFAEKLNVPKGLASEFKWRTIKSYPRWLVDLAGKVGLHNHLGLRETAARVMDVNSEPAINNSCFEVRVDNKSKFVIVSEEDNNWRLFIGDGDKFKEGEHTHFENTAQQGSFSGDLVNEGFQISLVPMSAHVSDYVPGDEYEVYSRISFRVSKGKSIQMRSLPVHMVREQLGLETKPKLGGYYYPGISAHEIRSL